MSNEISKNKEKGYIQSGIQYFFLEDNLDLTFNYHYHTFHKCLIIIKGDVEYTIEGRELHLVDGDILWVPNFEAHKVVIKKTKAYRRLVMYISPEFLELLSHEAHNFVKLAGKEFNYVINYSKELNNELEELTFRLIQCKINNELETYRINKANSNQVDDFSFIGSNLRLHCLFIQWFESYIHTLSKQNTHVQSITTRFERDIEMGIEYIRHNLHKHISIDEISEVVHLSKYHLMRKFKEIFNISVYQFILRERLNKARTLMKEGYPLSEIGFKVGFSDYTTFARAFKKEYSCSPKKFAQMHPSPHQTS